MGGGKLGCGRNDLRAALDDGLARGAFLGAPDILVNGDRFPGGLAQCVLFFLLQAIQTFLEKTTTSGDIWWKVSL